MSLPTTNNTTDNCADIVIVDVIYNRYVLLISQIFSALDVTQILF